MMAATLDFSQSGGLATTLGRELYCGSADLLWGSAECRPHGMAGFRCLHLNEQCVEFILEAVDWRLVPL